LHFLVFDNQRFLDGFMYKQVKVITLSTEGIQPTFDELQRFQAGLKKKDGTSSAADDIATLKQLTSKTKAKPRRLLFQKGDTVRVSSGESVGIIGIISAMDEKTVTIIPKTKGDSVKISSVLVPLEVIEKFFEVGDHIKVLTGRYEGETGLITKLDDGVATIFSDTTKKEVRLGLHVGMN
jgi:transcription elongation factor SPT5